jgi:hypothetical protein
MNPLIGKTLTGMKIAEDRQALLFQTTEGDVPVLVDADCCSYTWVENVELPALGFPATVTAVEELDLPEDAGPQSAFHPDHEYLQFYGCKISTDRGEIVIDYRNDSNGYYGGNLAWPNDRFYGGVFGQNVSEMVWQDIGQ